VSSIATLLSDGGPIMWGILALGLLAWFLLAERALWLFGPGARAALARARAQGADDTLAQLAEAELSIEASRGFALLAALISAAPLLGLLGTVSGMITTFAGLLLGSKSDAMATGIGEALLTTQYGLALAIPSAVVLVLLRRRAERLLLEARRNRQDART